MGGKPILELKEIASRPHVKQAAGYVMDAALLLEKDSGVQDDKLNDKIKKPSLAEN